MTTLAIADDLAVETTDSNTIPALAAGLLGIDAARRVGWAKAFENARRVESLSEDLRQVRDELKWLRRAYSRLLGFLDHIPISRSEVFNNEMKSHIKAEKTFRHDDAWDSGVALAWEHKAALYQWSPEEMEAHKHHVATKKKAGDLRTEYGLAKRMLKELYFAAADKGHRVETDSTGGEEICLAVCSCGATSGDEPAPRAEVTRWRRDHTTRVVYGIGYDEWWTKQVEEAIAAAAAAGEAVTTAREERMARLNIGVHFSPTELAARLGVSINTIYRWNKRGTGPRPIMVGRQFRYTLEEVERWESERGRADVQDL